MKSSSSLEKFQSYLAGLAGGNTAVQKDDAFFICTGPPLSPHRVEIPRSNVEAIQAHKASCEKCSRIEKERLQEKQLKNEGPLRVQYCLELIWKARQDIDSYKWKKAEIDQRKEKGEQQQPPDALELQKLRILEYDAGVGEATIKRELEELHKLLHHENQTIREGAREEYDKYLARMKRLKDKNKLKKKEGNRLLSVSPTCSPVGLLP